MAIIVPFILLLAIIWYGGIFAIFGGLAYIISFVIFAGCGASVNMATIAGACIGMVCGIWAAVAEYRS